MKASPSTNVDEGKQLNLSCHYKSNIAHDNVYWYKFLYKQINVSTNESFNLFISNSSKDDRGTYFCKVKNRVGIGVANITVTVNCKYDIISYFKTLIKLKMEMGMRPRNKNPTEQQKIATDGSSTQRKHPASGGTLQLALKQKCVKVQ